MGMSANLAPAPSFPSRIVISLLLTKFLLGAENLEMHKDNALQFTSFLV